MLSIRNVEVVRYICPLREGGSLPAIIDADDDFKYVLKFRGAGQGTKALIADFVGAELARKLGFKVPELVFANLTDGFGRTEPDEEIQDLLKFSVGTNLGVSYLSGAISFDPLVHEVDSMAASKLVWLDAYLMNIDRTVRNTNMLFWKSELWLIDFGAALYFHHNIENWEASSKSSFPAIKDHVLLPYAKNVKEANDFMKESISPQLLEEIIEAIPNDFISTDLEKVDVQERKKVYLQFLKNRMKNSDLFYKEISNASI